MKTRKLQASDVTNDRFLREGARSYLKAATALIAYEREVQKKCREVMEQCIDEYSSALKVPLRRDEIQSHIEPESDQWRENWRSLGAMIVRNEITPSLRWWGAYCCLVYQFEDPTVYCSVCEYFPKRTMAAELYQKFQRLNPKVEREDETGIGLRESLRVEAGSKFDERLGALFEQWIRLWKKVGGINAAFRA